MVVAIVLIIIVMTTAAHFSGYKTTDGHRRWCGLRSSRTRVQNSARGLTVIEMAIASAVLALAIIGALVITSYCFTTTQSTREFSRANQILQQKMEDLRLLSFADIQALPATFGDPSDQEGRYQGSLAKQNYRTSLSGEPVSVKITLTVTWAGRGGRTRVLNMTSVFTSTGLNEYIF